MKKILILLSTYNGEKYLDEQLNSIYAQKNVRVHILARDDGSTDTTLSILRKYQTTYGQMTIYSDKNIGCKKSFFKLIQIASSLNAVFDYYAFSDQDDIWDSDKLISAINILDTSQNKYKLYYSDSRCVDNNVKEIPVLPIITEESLPSAVISSHSLGCTQVFNNSLLYKASIINTSILPSLTDQEYMPQHDTWLLVTARSLNGFLYHDLVPHINYRQHASNVVGGGTNSSISTFFSRLKRHWQHPNMRSRLALYIIIAYAEYLPEASYMILTQIAYYKSTLKSKLRLLFSRKIVTGNRAIDIPMKILIALGRF